MYKLIYTKPFQKELKKLISKFRITEEKLGKTFSLLESNPFHPFLKTHQVESRHFGKTWSSKIDGDLRIIWNFDENDQIKILLLDIGGHSGKDKVYN